jgi:TRAP-type C4-dicarboxylate transport system substrate-binding protein
MQAAVLQGTKIAKVIHRGMTSAQDANAETILKEKGTTVTRLTSAQIDAFRQRSQGPAREWLEKEIGREWIDKLQAATRRVQEQA